MIKLFCAIFLLYGCSVLERDNKPQPSKGADFAALSTKYASYMQLTQQAFDQDGWILTAKCDALLHTSLLATTEATDPDVLVKSRDENGRWFRRPSKDCLSSGSSKSSISRDMLLGLLHPVALFKLQDVAEDLVRYAEENKWVMGEGDGSIDGTNRILLSPSFYNLMVDTRDFTKNSLDGRPARSVDEEDESAEEGDPYALSGSNVRFTDHLDALAIELRGTIYGGITDYELGLIKTDRDADPNNALYHAIYSKYTDGNQKKAVDILLREDLFPSDRLPTSADHCVDYLWMHGEKEKDWGPCDKGETHPGHDFLFVARIILENVGE